MTRLVTKQQSPRASHVLATIRVKDVKMFSVAGDLYPARCRPQIRFHLVNLASYWETYSHCYLFHFLSSGFFFSFIQVFVFAFFGFLRSLHLMLCMIIYFSYTFILYFLTPTPFCEFLAADGTIYFQTIFSRIILFFT